MGGGGGEGRRNKGSETIKTQKRKGGNVTARSGMAEGSRKGG